MGELPIFSLEEKDERIEEFVTQYGISKKSPVAVQDALWEWLQPEDLTPELNLTEERFPLYLYFEKKVEAPASYQTQISDNNATTNFTILSYDDVDNGKMGNFVVDQLR